MAASEVAAALRSLGGWIDRASGRVERRLFPREEAAAMGRVSTIGLVIACGVAGSAYAQGERPAPARRIAIDRSSGSVAGGGQRVLYSATVFAPNAAWLRVAFRDVQLAGDPETKSAAYIRLTSL